MKLDTYAENEKYVLSRFVIEVKGNTIVAHDYILFSTEEVIRKISHPAEIDTQNNTLVIDKSIMRGKDTSYNYEEFRELFRRLPQWEGTKYYLVKDHEKHELFLSVSGTPVRHSRDR